MSSAKVDMRGKHGNHAKGEAHGLWNSGKLRTSHGYVLVRILTGNVFKMGGVRDKRAKLEDLPEDLRIREFPI